MTRGARPFKRKLDGYGKLTSKGRENREIQREGAEGGEKEGRKVLYDDERYT